MGGPRKVRVATINARQLDLRHLVAAVDRAAAGGVDLIALPETCMGQGGPGETLDGPTIDAMKASARAHESYVLCPIDRVESGIRWNTAALIDRRGELVGTYDKVYPYWNELTLDPPVAPGRSVPVWEVDFGRVGAAICFDVNFPPVWEALARGGAELVVWSSAYAGGSIVGAYAALHHYYILTCTQVGDSHAYDITGEEIVLEREDDARVAHAVLDLDRGIYHENFNLEGMSRLLTEREGDVVCERHLKAEQWFVLCARRPGVSVRDLARDYGLEELRTYVDRSRRALDEIRDGAGLQG